ncbi:hypothetical protein [Kutzneria kofuensis]|uniref:TetR/AcrR family transcriptional regulator n=1 Tax=Kutzneria kofuensis TaxID=103725 RepID=UPI0031E655E2
MGGTCAGRRAAQPRTDRARRHAGVHGRRRGRVHGGHRPAAGLGVGTLYRHFPDRAALLALISCDVLSRLTARTASAAASDLPRWEVLLGYVRDAVQEPFAMLKSVPVDDPDVAEPVARLHAVVLDVIKAAQAEGSLRADIEPAAVLDLLSLVVCRQGARADDPLALVVLDGLRSR